MFFFLYSSLYDHSSLLGIRKMSEERGKIRLRNNWHFFFFMEDDKDEF